MKKLMIFIFYISTPYLLIKPLLYPDWEPSTLAGVLWIICAAYNVLEAFKMARIESPYEE